MAKIIKQAGATVSAPVDIRASAFDSLTDVAAAFMLQLCSNMRRCADAHTAANAMHRTMPFVNNGSSQSMPVRDLTTWTIT